MGLFEFGKAYKAPIRTRDLVRFTLGFLPYQVLLLVGAVRATIREMRGTNNWEKTAHSGAHRKATAEPEAVLTVEHDPEGGGSVRSVRPTATRS